LLPSDWDDFAQRCGCSFQVVGRAIAAKALIYRWTRKMYCFEVFVIDGDLRYKIAQAAIYKTDGRLYVVDRLAILTEFNELWGSILQEILDELAQTLIPSLSLSTKLVASTEFVI
jgi:hypothetical protein